MNGHIASFTFLGSMWEIGDSKLHSNKDSVKLLIFYFDCSFELLL